MITFGGLDMRVLLVEDDYAVSQSIETMLKKEGMIVDTTDLGVAVQRYSIRSLQRLSTSIKSSNSVPSITRLV